MNPKCAPDASLKVVLDQLLELPGALGQLIAQVLHAPPQLRQARLLQYRQYKE